MTGRVIPCVIVTNSTADTPVRCGTPGPGRPAPAGMTRRRRRRPCQVGAMLERDVLAGPRPLGRAAPADVACAPVKDSPWTDLLWEASPDALAISDAEGVVLAANPAYFALYGFSPEQVVGRSFAIVFPEAERAGAIEQYGAAFLGAAHPALFEACVQRADG